MKDVRAFLALELPEKLKGELGVVSDLLASRTSGYRWVKPQMLHLTLRFLGYIGAGLFEEVAKTIERGVKAEGAMTLTPSGVGAFPDERRARVVWVGLRGETTKLHALVAALDSSLEKLGIPPENRPFKAHLTLGRADKECRGSGLSLDRELLEWSCEGWEATELVLYESVLTRQGANHIERARGRIT